MGKKLIKKRLEGGTAIDPLIPHLFKLWRVLNTKKRRKRTGMIAVVRLARAVDKKKTYAGNPRQNLSESGSTKHKPSFLKESGIGSVV